MKIEIRQETLSDHTDVEKIICAAFADLLISDKTEHILVKRLRKSEAFIPELSLVAEADGRTAGHVLLTKLELEAEDGIRVPALGLAPISVLPEFQRMGIGKELILKAHEIAKKTEAACILLVGHEDYYPRFGYERTSKYNIHFPFEIPDENGMVYILDALKMPKTPSTVVYPRAFFE
ncbi:GNAT family N-acetyltransferase [Fulvivirga sedimenti]|uniref:N-acetyltransferase n=1 Tax=Fulvivirga sedimenti TaxID=2879465 RepID=A0A9X1HXE7_9BACT|nr:N-acetyltransferase [Fulvivirga sedimenti]MCA6079105.1 N-acetyltransferase [Fulvivirga sedimenti]